YEATEPFFVGLEDGYRNSLQSFLRHRWMALVMVVLCLGLIYFIGKALPSELAPLEDRNWVRLQVTAPEGSSYEYTDHFLMQLADFIHDSVPEKEVCLTVTAPGFTGVGAVNFGFVRLRFTDASERERSQQDLAAYLTKATSVFSQARIFVLQEQTISTGGGGPRGGLPVQFVLQAPNFEKLKSVLPVFLDSAGKSKVFQGIDVNLKFNRPEIEIAIDREKARSLGLSAMDIAQTLQLAYSGQRYGYFIQNGKQYQIIGQVAREDRDEPIDLKAYYVRSQSGQMIPLENIASLKEISSPPQLFHYNRYMSATVSAGLAPGYTISHGIDEMNAIAKQVLDESFSTALTGASRDFQESSSNVWFAFILALILIYLVLAAQFESFVDPFIIMITVPLAIAGALLSLWYFNQTFNIFSQIGIIMLIGLVTKNGILIVEFANQLQRQGKSLAESIREASVLRLRPILMTSIATALGALPIALALGAGAKSRMGMGIVVVGGILFSLILTLYVIPAFYSYLSKPKTNEDI
ncbi:MAG TPA: efflux RND transporter permease subunit, partial [Saprospiraceae bacterium]|nr:efflux RND transporter permease subunit [Saprospiraceae bacterium]